MKPEESVKAYFSEAYDSTDADARPWVTGVVGIPLQEKVINGQISSSHHVLDIGCGYGTEAIFLALQGATVVGLDVNARALQVADTLARTYGARVRWVHGNALELPFADCSFDVVLDQGCFHHVSPEKRSIYAREVHRVLRVGGYFYLRGFSDWVEPGTSHRSPIRLISRDILSTFLPFLECEEIYRYRSLPRKGKTRWFWWSAWVKIR